MISIVFPSGWNKPKGMALMSVLGVLTILFVLGAAILRRQAQAYQSVTLVADRSTALALAESGLEDARLKIERDYAFPPRSPQQQRFDYTEQVLDFEGVAVGFYSVSVDSSRKEHPTYALTVTVTGWVERGSKVAARQTLIADFDLSPTLRSSSATNSNPYQGRIVRMRAKEFGQAENSAPVEP